MFLMYHRLNNPYKNVSKSVFPLCMLALSAMKDCIWARNNYSADFAVSTCRLNEHHLNATWNKLAPVLCVL